MPRKIAIIEHGMPASEATGGYPPEIVDSKGKLCLDGTQMEVDGGRALFIPHRADGEPDPGVTIKKIRVTNGIFIRSKK